MYDQTKGERAYRAKFDKPLHGRLLLKGYRERAAATAAPWPALPFVSCIHLVGVWFGEVGASPVRSACQLGDAGPS